MIICVLQFSSLMRPTASKKLPVQLVSIKAEIPDKLSQVQSTCLSVSFIMHYLPVFGPYLSVLRLSTRPVHPLRNVRTEHS